MASDDKNQQVYPLAPAHEHPRSDEESANLQAKELKRKKRIKCAIYVAAFAVFQTAVILAFALTVMRVKNPKVRIGKLVSIERMETNNTGAAQFDLKFIAQVTAKLKGKVELLKVMKKKKSPEMNCTLVFNVSTKTLQDLNCK
ncbi:hypothetical protein COLO4_08343 [Corchorus olitorius]|uniref:Late embryogenesis abundant protein, LEA-14 n=1 Tax=Corchorus olitorius TaxID=93759 RepID=A0A1R3KG86_9ROSI|nr:hypothetical protein COLO4_08343 [Corchorus olitorius]